MTNSPPRRRILCVRPRSNAAKPVFFREMKVEWIRALEQGADVQVEGQDFDLQTVAEAFMPDLIIYESLDCQNVQLPTILNPLAFPAIPRVLFLTTDPHEPLRPLLFDRLIAYGITTVFEESGHIYSQFMPELAFIERFTVPSFIDSAIFKDYGLKKIIPISIMSAHLLPSFYPWRAQVTEDMQRLYPTLLYPHPGYVDGQQRPFAVRGEAYARVINQSYFSVADTTRHDYLVRKHLEIPAAGAVLVAPQSAALEENGFRDMENCVLGSGGELYGKIDVVARNPPLYAQIKQAGHDLVHSRYTKDKWIHILNWLECRTSLRPGETIVQDGIHGAFSIVSGLAGPNPNVHQRDNQMTAIFRGARTAIVTGRGLEQVVNQLKEASQWSDHIGEPFFLLGMIALLAGQPMDAALFFSRRPTMQGRNDAALAVFDPAEVAWVLLAGFLLGQEDLVQAMLAQGAQDRHISLRRVHWLLYGTKQDSLGRDPALHDRQDDDILSIHWVQQEDFATWCDIIRRIGIANGRADLMPALASSSASSRATATA